MECWLIVYFQCWICSHAVWCLTCVVALEPGLLLKNLFELAHPAAVHVVNPMPKIIPGTKHTELILQYLFITHHFLYFLTGMLLVFMSLTSVYLCYVCHYEEVLKVMRPTPSQEMPTEPSSQPSKAVPAYRSLSQVFVSGSLCFQRKPRCRGTFLLFFTSGMWDRERKRVVTLYQEVPL